MAAGTRRERIRTESARTLRRASRAALGALAAAIALLPCGGAFSEEAEEAASRDAVSAERGTIRIGSGGLDPKRYVAGADERISWSNEQQQIAVLSFPGELAEPLACGGEDVRPVFHPHASGRVVSVPIRSLPFALPCPLPKGSHDYRVHLVHGKAPPGSLVGSPVPIENPSATYEGTLVVE